MSDPCKKCVRTNCRATKGFGVGQCGVNFCCWFEKGETCKSCCPDVKHRGLNPVKCEIADPEVEAKNEQSPESSD